MRWWWLAVMVAAAWACSRDASTRRPRNPEPPVAAPTWSVLPTSSAPPASSGPPTSSAAPPTPLPSAATPAASASAAPVPFWARPKPMPPGGEWPGVYTSRFGELHVAVDGTVGRGFVRATNAVIELSGPIDGDVWLFSWKEQSQVTGETKQGRGYFRYRIIPRALQHELRGGWGLGDGPPANAWDAFKGRAGEAQP